MAKPKKIPAAMAVVRIPRAPQMVVAEGRLAVMERIRRLSDDYEKLISKLMQIATTDESTKNSLAAIEMLFAYGIGKPTEVRVTADASAPQPTSNPLAPLTAEQLEAVATSSIQPQSSEEIEDAQVDGAEDSTREDEGSS